MAGFEVITYGRIEVITEGKAEGGDVGVDRVAWVFTQKPGSFRSPARVEGLDLEHIAAESVADHSADHFRVTNGQVLSSSVEVVVACAREEYQEVSPPASLASYPLVPPSTLGGLTPPLTPTGAPPSGWPG